MTTPTRPVFAEIAPYIDGAFARRFRRLLDDTRRERAWRVVAAAQGSGKTWGIGDCVALAGGGKAATGATHMPVVAIAAPPRPAEGAVIAALVAAFGVTPPMTGDARREWLCAACVRCGVELIVADDAHGLVRAHLHDLKWVADRLALPPYRYRVGICLVAASGRGAMPLHEFFTAGDVTSRQFRRRLATERPFCHVLGHTREEVVELCAGYEDAYRARFPHLRLVRWASAIHAYLIDPVLDLDGTRRATMDNVNKLVVLALAAVHARGQGDVSAEILQMAAGIMTLRRDATTDIDGEPDAEGDPIGATTID